MGGYGSSRWGMTVTRLTTEGFPRLDIRMLARVGGLVPGTAATMSWHGGGCVTATIASYVPPEEPDCLVLDYCLLTRGGMWQPIRERFVLLRTLCHYGGARVWVQCPCCHNRRAVLYALSVAFRCRECHHLAYRSTREQVSNRLD